MKSHFSIISIFLILSLSQTITHTHAHTHTHSSKSPESNDLCKTCIKTVNEMKAILEDPVTHEKIKEGIIGICDTFPYPFSIGCIHAVEVYFDEFVEYIDNIPTNEICTQVHLCATNGLRNLSDRNPRRIRQSSDTSTITCSDTTLDSNDIRSC